MHCACRQACLQQKCMPRHQTAATYSCVLSTARHRAGLLKAAACSVWQRDSAGAQRRPDCREVRFIASTGRGERRLERKAAIVAVSILLRFVLEHGKCLGAFA